MKRRSSVGLAAASLVLVSLNPSGSASAGDRPPDGACTKRRTARIVRSFIAAYNDGNVARADGFWAQEPEFKWYFVDDEREATAEDRRTLPVYLAERARFGDRLRLLSLGVNRNGTGFVFELRRRTTDPRTRAAGRFHGKGSTGEVLLLPTPDRPVPTQGCALTVWAMDNGPLMGEA